MNAWIRLIAVSVCGLAAGCGGGGGGGGGMPMPTPDPMPVPPTPPGPTGPQSVADFQGLYGTRETDPEDPNVEIGKAQAIITSDGRALIYLDDVTDGVPFVVVFDGRLTMSGSDAMLTEATAYITDQAPVPASGLLRLDTDPGDDFDLLVELTLGGETFTVGLESLPDAYRMPSSLAAVRGSYENGSGVQLTIDPAGNVIVSQDPDTGCGAMGQVAVDMPAVNAYALSLRLMNCSDSALDGTYTGRLAIGDGLLGFIVHSDALPLFDPDFERIAP